MARTITIDPVTRIEGHARVELQVDDSNRVTGSVFKVMDFRGFETFLTGMQVEMMPTVTPRICGTCPQTHHLAAARAVDKVFGVTPPPAAQLLRYALNMGGILHSHGVHFFALAGPDLILGLDADPAERNIVGLLKAAPDVAKKALRLRTLGQKITELIGGRGTHPVGCVAGGLAAPLGPQKALELKKYTDECLPLGAELFGVAKAALAGKMELVTSLPEETHYMGTVMDGALNLNEGTLRLRRADGKPDLEFSEDDWGNYLHEEALDTAYAKRVLCRYDDEIISYRVGPLARLNVVDRIDTPQAQAELEDFRRIGGNPCHHTVMYHLARLIELLYACEKLHEIANEPEIASDNVRNGKLNSPRTAAAHVEAPRGNLIHEYAVDQNGIVERANLIVATQQNIDAINNTVQLSAANYIDQPDDLLLNGIEFGIRCYDPCLSCATHRVGEMKLDVQIRDSDGQVIRRVRR